MVVRLSGLLLVLCVAFSLGAQTDEELVNELITNSEMLEQIIAEQETEIENLGNIILDLQNGLTWQQNQLISYGQQIDEQGMLLQGIQLSHQNYVEDIEKEIRRTKTKYAFITTGGIIGGLAVGFLVGYLVSSF